MRQRTNRIRRHLTYGNVMATIAVFGVLGGGAYAVATKAPKDSVNSRSIVDNSVKSEDVKDDSLTGTDIQEATLQGVGGGGGSGGPPSGPAGGDLTGNYPKPQIAAGAVHSNQLGPVISVSHTVVSEADVRTSAECPAGTRLIGGGAEALSTADLIETSPGDLQGSGSWFGRIKSDGENGDGVKVYALCLQ